MTLHIKISNIKVKVCIIYVKSKKQRPQVVHLGPQVVQLVTMTTKLNSINYEENTLDEPQNKFNSPCDSSFVSSSL